MYILKVEVFGDFDVPYDVPVVCSSNYGKLVEIKDALNNYCAKHPNVNMGIPLHTIFECDEPEIYDVVFEVVNEEEVAADICDELELLCEDENITIGGYIFTIGNVVEI